MPDNTYDKDGLNECCNSDCKESVFKPGTGGFHTPKSHASFSLANYAEMRVAGPARPPPHQVIHIRHMLLFVTENPTADCAGTFLLECAEANALQTFPSIDGGAGPFPVVRQSRRQTSGLVRSTHKSVTHFSAEPPTSIPLGFPHLHRRRPICGHGRPGGRCLQDGPSRAVGLRP